MPIDRRAEIAAFLDRAGWADARRKPLAGDASARRYDRLTRPDDGRRAVLMDAPIDRGEDIAPFLKIAAYLHACGYSAPEILHADAATGLILMEDLGDALFARLCARDPSAEPLIYAAAIDLLVALHRQPPPHDLPPYSAEVYRREANLAMEWYVPAATGTELSPAIEGEYLELVGAACNRLAREPSVCVLRDYHAENLIWLGNRAAHARVGLLDFQDALVGHPAYDLVSLLEDARRDTSRELRQSMLDRYIGATGTDRNPFLAAYATLGAQRNLKIIGIFTRLWRRDGKPQYIDMIPRVWGHLQNDLSHPELAELSSFIQRHVPAPAPEILARIRQASA